MTDRATFRSRLSHPRRAAVLAVPLLTGSFLLGSCASTPQSSSSDDARPTSKAESVRLTQAPPPPGLDPAAVSPITGPAADLAKLSLADVLAAIETPAYLTSNEAVRDTSPDVPLAAQQFYAAGRQAALTGDNFQAVQQYEKALRLSPGQPDLLLALGKAWALAGNRVSAANFLRQAVQANPTDPEALMLIGRFAVEDRQWEPAIALLDAAIQANQSPGQPNDPAQEPVAQFLLATALSQAGYAEAAGEAYQKFAEAPRAFTRSTPYARELAVLDAQRGNTLVLLGDLQHRLARPTAALTAYETASEIGVTDAASLRRRLVYTHIRLGQTHAASDIAVQALDAQALDPAGLSLISYVIEQGAPAGRLADRLRELYSERGEPGSLALGIADALPPDQARELLLSHLDRHGDDLPVFSRLLDSLLADSPNAKELSQAASITARAMAQNPAADALLGQTLIRRVTDHDALLKALNRKPLNQPDAEYAPQLAVLRGLTLVSLDQMDDAFAAFEAAIQADPELALARLQLAAGYLSRKEYVEAERVLEPLSDSTDPRVAGLRVQALMENGKDAEALALLDELLKKAPADSPLAIQKAGLLLRAERVDEAEQVLLDALNARPTDENIYSLLLNIYNDNGGDSKRYQRLMRRMIDTIPNARVTRLALAELQITTNDFAAAEKNLDQLLTERPDDVAAKRILMELYIRTNRADKATSMIDEWMADDQAELDPQLMRLAEGFFRNQGDQERWHQMMERRLLKQPVGDERNHTLAMLYFTRDDYEKALAMADELLDAGAEPGRVPSLSAIVSESLSQLGREDEVVPKLKKTLAKYPEQGGDIGYLLAMNYERKGDTDESQRIMEETLKKHPDHAQLNNALGYAWANEGKNLERAKVMIERAVQAEPNQAAYLDSLGWVYYKLGQFDQSVQQLQLAKAQPDGGAHPVILNHLGDALYRQGKHDEAVRLWTEASTILADPDFETGDPEADTLAPKLTAKLQAVQNNADAPVAPIGEAEPPAE